LSINAPRQWRKRQKRKDKYEDALTLNSLDIEGFNVWRFFLTRRYFNSRLKPKKEKFLQLGFITRQMAAPGNPPGKPY
jgi:hypothetical protein